MELCRTYGAIECSGIIDDRVAPYPKLYHPFRVFVELTLIMKKILLPLIGLSLITMLTAFSCYENEEEYDNSNGIASDTVVKDTTIKITDKSAEEWSD